MTKKPTSVTSTRRRESATEQGQAAGFNRTLSTILIVGLLAAAGYFLVTGGDPLGLFTEPTPTPRVIVGSGGAGWQVYFTDPLHAGDLDDLRGTPAEKLIEHIEAAQRTIHVAAFEFNLTPVAEALIAAHQRGVEVLWVTDDEHGIEADEEDDHGQFATLAKAGIEVRDDGRGALMHNKFWIFDAQTVWTGSTNITVNGMFRNNNNVIVFDSPELAAIFEREFAEMWAGEYGPTSPSTVEDQRVIVSGGSVQALFAPEDEVASQLVPLIEGAQHSIRFMAFAFTHEGIGQAVLARARAGVNVRGIFETTGSETEYSEMPLLYCAGVLVRQDGNPRTFHHKVFVIDEQIVVTGSFNFTDNADESNDENVVVVANTDVAAQYLQEFERRWAEATAPDYADMNCE
jgi:phosphatidylserine/phosphatidylglycerophosphate/cardiolipin synthase-like enzyme